MRCFRVLTGRLPVSALSARKPLEDFHLTVWKGHALANQLTARSESAARMAVEVHAGAVVGAKPVMTATAYQSSVKIRIATSGTAATKVLSLPSW